MCQSCAASAAPAPLSADASGLFRGLSRRGLLAGAGLGALAVHLPTGSAAATEPEAAETKAAASARNGAWACPALGRFPAGGHYGAPRGGASHAGQDVSNSTGTAVHAAAARSSAARGVAGCRAGRATPW